MLFKMGFCCVVQTGLKPSVAPAILKFKIFSILNTGITNVGCITYLCNIFKHCTVGNSSNLIASGSKTPIQSQEPCVGCVCTL